MGKFFETYFVWALYVFFAICTIVALVCTIAIMPLAMLGHACFYVLSLPIKLYRTTKQSCQK